MQQKTLLLLALLLFTFSCQKDDDDPIDANAQLIVSPAQVMLNDNEEGKILLSVQPKSNVSWQVAGKPAWLQVSPASGTYAGQIQELKLTPQPTGLDEGQYTGTVEIISDGAGKASTEVKLYVGAHPLAEVSPATLTFPAGTDEQLVTVKNAGTGHLNANFSAAASWLSFEPAQFILSSGSSQPVTVRVNRQGLAVGTVQATAVLQSNSEGGAVNLPVSLSVPETGLMSASVDSLTFNYFVDTRTAWLRNAGNTAFQWNLTASQPFVEVSPASGTLAPGDSVLLTATVKRDNFSTTNVYTAGLTVQNNKGASLSLPVAVRHFKEEKWLLSGRVIDAEYDRANDVLVAVTEAPNRLLKLYPETQTIQSVQLDYVPTCVSVAPNGSHAAVGHNGSFSYVNLGSLSVQKVYSVTADALDIVLAPNNWAYVFPRQDQWEQIRCINLATGAETPSTDGQIYAGTRAKLHPSGTYIYGADNGLSPSDFEKYAISGGTAQLLYDSPYHGDYDFGGDLWFSDDGNRIFARSRNVFKSSTQQSIDMTYNGALTGDGYISTLDHSSAANKIYAVFSDGLFVWDFKPSNQIRKYDAQFLGFQGTETLPGFLTPDGTGGGTASVARGYFGFFNAAGSKYYVLVKADDGSGSLNEWALVSVPVQ